MIDLYTAATPNGWKVTILLEEMDAEYAVHPVALGEREQDMPEYRALNPNGRIPTLVDREADDFPVFESGAILIYLAEKFGRFLPLDVKGRSRVIQWLMFQMAGVGPMQGQAAVFHSYFEQRIPAAIDRYQHETRRLYEVLDQRLDGHDFLCDEYSIADMAVFPWVHVADRAGVTAEGLDHLNAWYRRLAEREAVQRALAMPEPMTAEAAQEVVRRMLVR